MPHSILREDSKPDPNEDSISERWPKLIKYSEEYKHLFPRIEFSDRDKTLEGILSEKLRQIITQENEADFIEASRRLREARKHNAHDLLPNESANLS